MKKKMKMHIMDDGGGDEDGWVTAAMRDDSIVADLLSRLKIPTASTATASSSVERSLVPAAWGFRRRRSSGADLAKKEGEAVRCSPNTPFSWSEFTDGSPSNTGDGGETSSQLNYSSLTPRSKVAVTNEVASSSDRKSRNNVKDLTTYSATFNDHNSRNGRLKRLKVEHNPQHATRPYAGFYDENDNKPCSSNYTQQTPVLLPNHPAIHDAPQSDSLKTEKHDSSLSKRNFILPDLNMPAEDGDDSW